MTNFTPTPDELSNNLFIQSPVNKTNYLWYCTINRLNDGPRDIIYNKRNNTFRYSKFHYRIENLEEMETLIKILSKGK